MTRVVPPLACSTRNPLVAEKEGPPRLPEVRRLNEATATGKLQKTMVPILQNAHTFRVGTHLGGLYWPRQ